MYRPKMQRRCYFRGPPHLVVHPLDIGDVHVVSGGTYILIFLPREDVNANQVDLLDKQAHIDE